MYFNFPACLKIPKHMGDTYLSIALPSVAVQFPIDEVIAAVVNVVPTASTEADKLTVGAVTIPQLNYT